MPIQALEVQKSIEMELAFSARSVLYLLRVMVNQHRSGLHPMQCHAHLSINYSTKQSMISAVPMSAHKNCCYPEL